MHGGAKGSGAPKDNKNALKHGTYTREAFKQRAAIDELFEQLQRLPKEE
jgi:glucans biosynthesis protein